MLAAVKSRTIQWLPYWTNGNVPLVALIRAAGPEAVAKLDGNLNLGDVVDGYMQVGLGSIEQRPSRTASANNQLLRSHNKR